MNTLSRTAVGATAFGLAVAVSACSTQEGEAAAPVTSNSPSPTAEATVLELTMDPARSEQEMVDVGKKGDSTGDRNLAATTLLADGEVAGRLQGDCVTLDNEYEGHLCSMVVVVEGGTITLVGGGTHKPVGPVAPTGDVLAVTGGTGEHAGASGEVTVGDDGQTLTITLLP
ncbi:hypothetical protein [Nocardioides caldifontis]|uniref:hypothetical protein n=1 Tax=Nocardioides caldifontis TaxID=2588938 RepID=UPI0011E04729|nr:hypothetical protein [Nocardioides caldifontis]